MNPKKETRCLLLKTAQRLLGQQPNAQEETRWRLLQAATEVFARLGTRRDHARDMPRAGVNLASIHYYYGDKAELYREVFRLPFLNESNMFPTLDIGESRWSRPVFILPVVLSAIAEEDPMQQLFMRLHAREEADPACAG